MVFSECVQFTVSHVEVYSVTPVKKVMMEKNVAYELHVPHKAKRHGPSLTPQAPNPIYEDLK